MTKNEYPCRLSREGYEKLEKIMMIEKRKQSEEELGNASLSLDCSPYPLSLHENWNSFRQMLSGKYTSEPTCVVGENIISRFFCQEY